MKTIMLLSFLVLAISGCSSTPSMSDYANNPDGMWQEGKNQSEKGEKLMIKGEKSLEDARTLLREGEALIHSGTERILRARQDYQNEASQIGSSSTPKEIEYEAKKLNAIGDRWEDAIDDVKDGNAMVTKSNKMQDKAQAQIQEGRQLIETGSNLIRNSQRMRMNIPLLPAPNK